MSNRKLVMEEYDGKVLIGFQKEGCDPQVDTREGTIESLLPAIPEYVATAEQKWAESPKMPAYKPPAEPKPAAATAQKAEELPLLANQEKPKAEAPAPEPAPSTEAPTEAPVEAPAEEPTEAPAEEVAAEETKEGTEEKVAEPTGPAEEQAPEPEAPAAEAVVQPAEPVHTLEKEGATEEGKAEDMATMREDITQAQTEEPAAAPTEAAPTPAAAAPTGGWDYYLKDGRGPFADIQAAMDEMGMDQQNRPHHNRWDRLSSALKDQIQKRPKS